jgi:hypothetical protein
MMSLEAQHSLSWSSLLPNASSIRMKRQGERGHPCLSPLEALKKEQGHPVDQRGYPGAAYTGLNPIDERGVESKIFECLKEEAMVDSVKGISHIQLDYHAPFSSQFT